MICIVCMQIRLEVATDRAAGTWELVACYIGRVYLPPKMKNLVKIWPIGFMLDSYSRVTGDHSHVDLSAIGPSFRSGGRFDYGVWSEFTIENSISGAFPLVLVTYSAPYGSVIYHSIELNEFYTMMYNMLACFSSQQLKLCLKWLSWRLVPGSFLHVIYIPSLLSSRLVPGSFLHVI